VQKDVAPENSPRNRIANFSYFCSVQFLRILLVFWFAMSLALPKQAFHFVVHVQELVNHLRYDHKLKNGALLSGFVEHTFPQKNENDPNRQAHKHFPCSHSIKTEMPNFLVSVPAFKAFFPKLLLVLKEYSIVSGNAGSAFTGYSGEIWQPPRKA
jgi:hypothetical protein